MEWLTDVLQWLLDLLLYIPKVVFMWLLEAGAALINALSFVCGFGTTTCSVEQWATLWGSVPPEVAQALAWFLGVVQFKFGLQVVACAYFARWVVRRIPFFG